MLTLNMLNSDLFFLLLSMLSHFYFLGYMIGDLLRGQVQVRSYKILETVQSPNSSFPLG